MFKQIVSVLLVLALLLCLGGCKLTPDTVSSEPVEEESSTVSVEEEKEYFATNPLTGVKDLEIGKEKNRPVGIMINNISIAQKVQSGLNKADIIYETEVEGGITRLFAVFQDISVINRIGTIRSARYPYIDLAMGHNALYIHCGTDKTYAAPHLNDLDDMSVDTNSGGLMRISNGLAKEHTLYADGAQLWENLQKNRKTENSSTAPWQNFADADEEIVLGTAATSVSVKFSHQQTSSFEYDAATGLYTRHSNGNVPTDYFTGEATAVKNVFVLMTSISNYPDGYHRQVALSGGEGYYFTNGTYCKITWSKGAASNGLSFKDADGKAITVSAGSSWVCLADSGTSQPVIA